MFCWAFGITDNPSVPPPISASLQTRFDSTNKEMQTQGLNEAIMGPFSSSNGLITATTPDEVCGNPEIMTSGMFDDVVLQRTSSNNWSQAPCPAARTFTKVFVRKIHQKRTPNLTSCASIRISLSF